MKVFFVIVIILFSCTIDANASITIYPLKLTLDSDKKVESISIINNGKTKRGFHIDVMKWKRENGKDVLEDTEEFIITPAIFEVEANSEKIARISPHHLIQNDTEQTYRMVIKEFSLNKKSNTSGIQLMLELRVPVFIKPIKSNELGLECANDLLKTTIICTNKSNQHLFIRDIFNHKQQNIKNIFSYIFPNEEKLINLKTNPDQHLHVRYLKNDEEQVAITTSLYKNNPLLDNDSN